MSSITKFAWSGVAVVLAVFLTLGVMTPKPASAGIVWTGGATTVSIIPAVTTTTGPGTSTVLASAITATSGAAGDFVTTHTIILVVPTGYKWDTTVTPTHTYPAGTTAAAPTYSKSTGEACSATSCSNMILTLAGTSTAAGALVIGGGGVIPKVVALGNTTASGWITIGGGTSAFALPGLNVAFLTISGAAGAATQLSLVRTASSTACGATNPVTSTATSLVADGAVGTQLCASLTDAVGMPVAGVAVTFTVSVGYVSTGTGKTTVAFTSAAGNATTSYRGAGNTATTDTAVASVPSLSIVATPLSITLTTPSGSTAAKVTIQAATTPALGLQVSNTAPGYSSPSVASNLAIQVTDSSGLGVNGQSVQISVDRGGLVANAAFATTTQTALQTLCTASPARSIIVTTVGTDLLAVGGSATAGAGDFVVCTNQVDGAGKITVTVSNITTSMANATYTTAQANRPASVTVKVDGSTLTATVRDAGGNLVADGTPINFTMSSNVGALSTTCTTSSNGTASSVAALAGATGSVLVSTNWGEAGTIATTSTCAVAGAQSIARSVSLPSGEGGAAAVEAPKPAAGSGLLVGSATVPATGTGLIVFSGGSTDQLVAASGCPKATAAFWATSGNVYVTFVPGTSVGAVNADFNNLFKAGIPANTALIGRCA